MLYLVDCSHELLLLLFSLIKCTPFFTLKSNELPHPTSSYSSDIYSFPPHSLKYTVSQQGDRDIYFGDDDTIRHHWHDDFVGTNFLGHNGDLHVFYRPVNDMRVLLPLVVCIIVAWIRSFFFLVGMWQLS